MSHPTSNREKILECAKELFYHVGYQATSVDDILKHCSVAKSNFYYHFESKEQLAAEVLDRRIEEYDRMVQRTLRCPELSPVKRLDKFFAGIKEAQGEVSRMAGCPFGNFAAALPSSEQDPRQERFRKRLSQLFLNMETAIRECLTEGVEHGEFRGDIPPAEMAAFLVATVQGLLILTKTHKDTAPLISGFAVVQKLIQTC